MLQYHWGIFEADLEDNGLASKAEFFNRVQQTFHEKFWRAAIQVSGRKRGMVLARVHSSYRYEAAPPALSSLFGSVGHAFFQYYYAFRNAPLPKMLHMRVDASITCTGHLDLVCGHALSGRQNLICVHANSSALMDIGACKFASNIKHVANINAGGAAHLHPRHA